jgi:photosystem II stability/assembly factor-like uncharacterized protein
VVEFPDGEVVFTHSGGSCWKALTVAQGVGVALAENAERAASELVLAAEAIAAGNGAEVEN